MWLSDLVEQRVIQRFIDCDSEIGVKLKHLVQEVDRVFACTRILLVQIHSYRSWESAEVLGSLGICHETFIFFCGSTNHLKDDGELIIC